MAVTSQDDSGTGDDASTEEYRTPWQKQRDAAEENWDKDCWGPYHRHFANDAVHRDGKPECDQPGTPRRVYVFDPDYLHEHEMAVARYAIAHPEEFGHAVACHGMPERTEGGSAPGRGERNNISRQS